MNYYIAYTPNDREFIKSDIALGRAFETFDEADAYRKSLLNKYFSYSIWVSNGDDFTKLFPED